MYLLDTHALLFFLNNDPALSLRARSIIENEWKLYISIVSFWEIAIKIGPGKLSISGSVTKRMKYCEETKSQFFKSVLQSWNEFQHFRYITVILLTVC